MWAYDNIKTMQILDRDKAWSIFCYKSHQLQTYAAANTIMSDKVKEQCGPGGGDFLYREFSKGIPLCLSLVEKGPCFLRSGVVFPGQIISSCPIQLMAILWCRCLITVRFFYLTPPQLENCEVFNYRFWSSLQEKQFKSIRISLAESEAAEHEGLIIFLRTFSNNQLSKGVWVKRSDL